jgi:hypothetical protein
MNTKQRNRLKRKMQAYNASKAATNVPIDAKPGQPLAELFNMMQSVDMKSKEAKQNEESMTDADGNQIWYNWLFKGLGKAKEDNKK